MTNKKRIRSILNLLNKGLYEREEIIAITLLSALAEQNIFLFGAPGTAKSLISRRLSKAFETNNYFEHLMQKFSTPEEVFGPISITELKKDNYIRKTEGFLPEAEFAFLDEIWKSSPAILNTLLTIINEKKFKNGSDIKEVPLKVLISASNETPPENQGLDALYDRFLTRLLVPPVTERSNFETILQNGSSSENITIPDNLKLKNDELQKWQIEINKVKLSADTLHIINGIRLEFEKLNRSKTKEEVIYVSDRRWQKAATLLKASAFFCDRLETNIADCLLLSYCLWTKPENRENVKNIVEEIIKDNGFQSDVSLLEIDTEKDNLEKEINSELYYSLDVYKTVQLTGNVNYFKCVREFKLNDGWQSIKKRITFYVPQSQMKKQGVFHPIDESGNEYKWIKCEFNKQGSCNIKINQRGREDSYYLSNDRNFESVSNPFKPAILFHKGDKKEEVNERLISALNDGVTDLKVRIDKTLNSVKSKRGRFLKSLETPFQNEKQLEVAMVSVDKQIEDLELRLKDCERLSSLVG